MQDRNWDSIRRWKTISIVALLLIVFPSLILASQVSSEPLVILSIVGTVAYIVYLKIYRKLFRQNCPVCTQPFYTQPGSFLFARKCANCGAKIGSEIPLIKNDDFETESPKSYFDKTFSRMTLMFLFAILFVVYGAKLLAPFSLHSRCHGKGGTYDKENNTCTINGVTQQWQK